MIRRSIALTVVLMLGGACSADPARPGADGGAGQGGSGGAAGSVGAAGSSGAAGSAGTAGSSGVAGSSGTAGTGGVAGSSGTAGTGGVAGSSGTAGTAGGTGGTPVADAAASDARGDASDGGTPPMGKSLDECFVGLRAGTGDVQLATKTSTDGTVRYRIALETADRFGTSGSKPWLAYRLAIETPAFRACVTDENTLKTAYMGSLHNCDDKLVVTVEGRRYEIDAPDTGPSPGSTVARTSALSVFTGTTRVLGPVSLTKIGCTSNAPTKTCTSGGPC